ncbi:hypothetical protein Bca101_043253 [Brassica carinata]
MWLYRRTSSFLFGFTDTILKKLGVSESAFVITAKVAEEEAADSGYETGDLSRRWRFTDNGFAVCNNRSACGIKLAFIRRHAVEERYRKDVNECDS